MAEEKEEIKEGCRAYPKPGAPAEWCEKNQGEWCGSCKHRRAKGIWSVSNGRRASCDESFRESYC